MAEEQEQAVTSKNTVTIEEAGPCRKKVIVEVPEETIKGATDEQYENLRKEALVPGFRKGRAPRRLLEKRFGKETSEQIKLKLLAETSEAAIKDNELNVLREPDIDFEKVELPETGPMKFDFEVEVRPEFELPELEGIAVEKTRLQVTDEQIDRDVEQRLKWSGAWTPRHDEPVQLDDQIIADAVLKVEGVEEDDKRDNIEIYVRPSGFVAGIPVEKLDELLVGAKSGDTRQTTVEVPKTYFREEYRGKKVDVEVQVKDVKWLKPAALNEDFFKRFSVQDETALRENIRDVLHGQLEQQAREQMSGQIHKYLLDNTSFELPLDVVADHSATLLKRQYVNLLMRGLPREQVDEHMEQLRASSEEQAKEQLRTFFVMDKVAEKLEIEVSDEEVNGHIAQLAIQRGQRPERLREEMTRDGSLEQFKLQVREQKCVAKLLESAKISEVEPKKKPKAKKAAKKAVKKTAKKATSAEKKPAAKRKPAAKKKAKE
jgi:trigger factor